MPLSGPVGTPLFGGVAIVSPDFSVSARWKPISRDKPQKIKKFKESRGWYTPTLFSGTPPPLSLYRKACGPQYHEKHPKSARSNRLRKPGGPVRRIDVNRDPFRPGSRADQAPVLSEANGIIKPARVNETGFRVAEAQADLPGPIQALSMVRKND